MIKKGGILYIKTLIRESCNEKIAGLHQWNLDKNGDGDFVLWNEESFANISKKLIGICEIDINHYPSDERGLAGNWGFMTVCITKKNNCTEEKNSRMKYSNCCEEIFNQIVKKGNYLQDKVWQEGYEKIFKEASKKC